MERAFFLLPLSDRTNDRPTDVEITMQTDSAHAHTQIPSHTDTHPHTDSDSRSLGSITIAIVCLNAFWFRAGSSPPHPPSIPLASNQHSHYAYAWLS